MSGIVHLKEEVAQLSQERDALQTQLEELENAHRRTVENANNVCNALIQTQLDLQAARSAAELAATHRKQLEQVVHEYHRQHDVQLLRDWNQRCACSSCKRATELLSETQS